MNGVTDHIYMYVCLYLLYSCVSEAQKYEGSLYKGKVRKQYDIHRVRYKQIVPR